MGRVYVLGHVCGNYDLLNVSFSLDNECLVENLREKLGRLRAAALGRYL